MIEYNILNLNEIIFGENYDNSNKISMIFNVIDADNKFFKQFEKRIIGGYTKNSFKYNYFSVIKYEDMLILKEIYPYLNEFVDFIQKNYPEKILNKEIDISKINKLMKEL
jgi:hypothetical protein